MTVNQAAVRLSVFFGLLCLLITCSVSRSFAGEMLRYDIKKFKLPAGDAFLKVEGLVTKKDKQYFLIIFTADGPSFYDEEKIYLDPVTYYPEVVSRKVDFFGKHENITEFYDHQKGEITIFKRAGNEVTKQTIHKKGPIDNIYGFIYRYRQSGSFNKAETLLIKLPTKDVTIRLTDEMKIGAAGKEFDTFLLQTDPKQYSVWFDKSAGHLPVRIDGAVGFAKTTMILDSYE